MRQRPSQFGIATRSASMQRALASMSRALQSAAPIILRAEIGSEAGVLARVAHEYGPRRRGSFLSLSCPSIIELPASKLEQTRGGTLFLDGVSELAAGPQRQLVHALDKLSANGATPHLISATTRDLEREVGQGTFRQDLFFRLNIIDIRIPPLRERPEDILPLARELLISLSAELGRRCPVLSRDADAVLLAHRWPANLRELGNTIERALMTSPRDVLEPEAFREILTAESPGRLDVGGSVTLRDLECEHITRVLARAPSLVAAATVLGVSRSKLSRWRMRHPAPAPLVDIGPPRVNP